MKLLYLLTAAMFFSCHGNKTTGTAAVNSKDSSVNDMPTQVLDSLKPNMPVDSSMATIPANQLIVAGKSIGLTHIGQPTEEAIKHLGKPDAGDAAMGKSVSTWFSKKEPQYKTQVYSSIRFGSDGDKPSVRSIRVTNPFFVTANGLKAGSRLNHILTSFNGLLLSGSYKSGKETIKVYDDTKQGIAFEINEQETCVGVCVHATGEKAFVQYLPFEETFTPADN